MSQNIIPGYYCVANVNYPPAKSPIPIERVFFLLSKIAHSLGQLPFRWQVLYKPKDGECFIINQIVDEIADDGYYWTSRGCSQIYEFGPGKAVEMISGQYGYSVGDKFASISRTRYRLPFPGNTIYFMHYLSVPEQSSIPIGPPIPTSKPMINNNSGNIANLPPRNTAAYRPHYQGPPAAPITRPSIPSLGTPIRQQPVSSVNRPLIQNHISSSKSQNNFPPTPASQPVKEDVPDLIIEDVDLVKPSEISVARFKLNHQLMEKILTPLEIKSEDFKTVIEESKKSLAELEIHKAKIENEVAEMQRNTKKTDNLEMSFEEYKRLLKQVESLDNEEELKNMILEFEQKYRTRVLCN